MRRRRRGDSALPAALVALTVTLTGTLAASPARARPAEQHDSSPSDCAVIGQGATGAAVAVIQKAVHAVADGQYGGETSTKLRKWQAKHDIPQTGVVDAQTWAAFPAHVSRKACRRGVDGVGVSCASLRAGSTGVAVAVLQRALHVDVDGQFGPATQSALKSAQRKAKLDATGVTDVGTWKALGLKYTPVCAELTKDERKQAKIRAHVQKLAAKLQQVPGTATSKTQLRAYHFDHKQLGKPYKYGGVGPKSYDCSGLQMKAYAHAHVTIPRVAAAQYADGGHRVSLSKARRGDLLFFASDVSKPSTVYHVSMYIGHGKILEAPYTGAKVRIVALWTGDLLPQVVRPSG